MAIQHNAPKAAPRGIVATYFYYGTDAVAEGEPFVLDPTDASSHYQPNVIRRPTTSGDQFVGVAARSYPADSGARQIEVYLPGSRNVNVRVGATVTAGAVIQFGRKASVGSKIFIAAGSPHALTALQIGDVIVREAKTVSSGTALVAADIPLGPLAAGVEES